MPSDPKQCRKAPSGNSTYAQAGGVYPIATFVDVLVDLALESEHLTINWEDVKKPGATRHPPGLKFLLTELICSAAGGPEQVTATGFDDAKLGVKDDEWEVFTALVKKAAGRVWPQKDLVSKSLEALVQEQKPEICIGMVQQDGTDAGRKLLRDAGYSHVQATAALLESVGDGPKALELLKGGFQLPEPTTLKMAAGARCPFGFGGGGGSGAAAVPVPPPPPPTAGLAEPLANAVRLAHQGGMPAAQIAATMKFELADVEATLAAAAAAAATAAAATAALPEGLANAVRTMASNSMTANAIALVMKLELTAVQQALAAAPPAAQAAAEGGRCPFGFDKKPAAAFAAPSSLSPAALVETLRERFGERADKADGHVAGRVLGDDNQCKLDELLVEPAELCCPITLMLFTDPVIAGDGCIYERKAISVIVTEGKMSPMSLEPLEPTIFPATKQHLRVLSFMAGRASELLAFASEHGALLATAGGGGKANGATKQLPLGEAIKIIKEQLGLEGTAKSVVDEAAEQLGVDTSGKLIEVGNLCVEALGYAEAANEEELTAGESKMSKWAARVTTVGGVATMVSTALDRAQIYVSALLSADAADGKKIATEFHALCATLGRPMTSDVLSVVKPKEKMHLRIRVMTGDETSISVLPTVTVAEAADIAIDKIKASKDKGRTLNKENKQLPPNSLLAKHQIVDGSLLHLILKPPAVPVIDGPPIQNLLAAVNAEKKADAHFRAYGEKLGVAGVVNLSKPLYARCGGIFGIAAFVDRCMDAWMADPILNANNAVATWHQRAQRCGFKFLVT